MEAAGVSFPRFRRNFQTGGGLKEEQIVDFMSLARTFPGIIVVNFSILSGYAMCGIPGAVAAAFGLVSPAVLVIGLVACFYDFISTSPYVIRVMNGIRSAVVPIVLLASWKLKNSGLETMLHLILAWAAFGVFAFTSVPKSVTILAGAAIGFVIQRRGIPGAICATLGTMMPSLTLCLAAACFIRRFRDHAGLNQLLRGIRPVCLGMLLAIAFTMGESVLWSG